jgi:hypothetical protein
MILDRSRNHPQYASLCCAFGSVLYHAASLVYHAQGLLECYCCQGTLENYVATHVCPG